MDKINRILTNICSSNLLESKNFYTKLFDFKIDYDSDWFVHLVSKDQKLELGIIKRNSEMVPKDFQNPPQGFFITFVVDNVDRVCEVAKSEEFEIIYKPMNTSYGQRRLFLKDPDGTLVDVSSPIKDFQFS